MAVSYAVELPPMPDRETGQPRPPRAPAKKSNARPVPWNARQVPQPPDSEGPVLEWYYANRGARLWNFAFMVLVAIVFATIYDGGFGWMRFWGIWAIIAVGGLLLFLSARTHRFSAGANWFMHRKDFVKMYELTSVKFEKDFGDGVVDLDDRYGGGVKVSLTWLWSNPELWDLLYNGIRHSVANGARVNDLAVERLRLFDVALMGQQRRGERPPSG